MKVQAAIYTNENYAVGARRLIAQLSKAGFDPTIHWMTNVKPIYTFMPWLSGECFEWFDQLRMLAVHQKNNVKVRQIVIDADMLVVGDISELLTMQTTGWALVPDHYDVWQTGISVMDSWAYDWQTIYEDLIKTIGARTWHKGDQTLLNEYLALNPEIKITELPKGYSWCSEDGVMTAEAKILHFHGITKPWMEEYNHRHPFANEWNKKQIYE